VTIDVDDRAEARGRPTPEQTFAAAVDLVTRSSGSFKRFALRYSLCTADAEDAYQRSLEILLRKAPTADRGELRAWLHTVIKHEALAVRRQRERTLAGSGDEPPEPVAEATPALDEQASGRERVRRTAEALRQLKPSELQCMLLKALGYSYDEIAERTGFSWTKVNRSLTEGRRRFLDRFGELSTGQRCDEVQALLSTACDGEASPEQEHTLRAHLAGCGSCRAALRKYRAAPRQVAELFPPGIVVGLAQQQSWLARLGDWLSVNSGDRAGALAWKVQQSAEALGAQKAAAVVASTAALAGGTAVQEHRVHGDPGAKRTSRVEHAPRTAAAEAVPVPGAPVAAPPVQPVPAAPSDRASDRPVEAKAAPAEEFAPAPAGAPASAPEARVTTASGGGEFGAPGSGGGSESRSGGEFGP
jgi:RNA polymerase sigma factor (sigma-70 family)